MQGEGELGGKQGGEEGSQWNFPAEDNLDNSIPFHPILYYSGLFFFFPMTIYSVKNKTFVFKTKTDQRKWVPAFK